MPWRKALENIADVEEYYLDILGFSPGMTWYEARFPSGHEGRRKVFGENALRLFKIDVQGRRLNL
jgi:predicted TIM-barrel fold metal-dependent hydrolase